MFIQKLFEYFPKRWPRKNAQRERKLAKFDSFRKLSLVWRTLLTNLGGFRTTYGKKKEAGVATNKYKGSSIYDQFLTPLPPPSGEMNNRSIV